MDDKARVRLGKKATNIALVVNIFLMLSKALVGIITGSSAIIADAFNNGTDIFATIAVFGGLRVAYLPPDENHHYGHAKAESIVSKIVAIIIMITGLTIGWDSLRQIFSAKSQVTGYLVIIVPILSIFFKFFLYKYTNKVGTTIESPSITADSYNHRSDVLASTAVLLGVAGSKFGFPLLDPIAGLIVSIIIFRTGILIYIEAINALMDTAPPAEVIDNIKKTALGTRGVIEINDIRAREQGPMLHVDLKICVDKNISVEEGHKIASETKKNIIKNNTKIHSVMVHVNPCTRMHESDSDRCVNCSLKPAGMRKG